MPLGQWITHLRRLSRSRPMALIPSEGIIMAPMPNNNINGATFVIREGTSDPKVPTIEAATDMGD